jgi:hypothetical protein
MTCLTFFPVSDSKNPRVSLFRLFPLICLCVQGGEKKIAPKLQQGGRLKGSGSALKKIRNKEFK